MSKRTVLTLVPWLAKVPVVRGRLQAGRRVLRASARTGSHFGNAKRFSSSTLISFTQRREIALNYGCSVTCYFLRLRSISLYCQ
jgi:hypothetical protein